MGQSEAVSLVVNMCKHFEGFSSEPYICPAGYATIGYGTVFKPDGSRVTMSHPPVTQEQAEEWLRSEIENNYMKGVLKASPCLAKYPFRLAAITDFAYNLGVPRYRASTLRKYVDKQDWGMAKVELSKWVFAGGRKLPGLVRRRQAEINLM